MPYRNTPLVQVRETDQVEKQLTSNVHITTTECVDRDRDNIPGIVVGFVKKLFQHGLGLVWDSNLTM